jgi:hypothetical protein
MNLKDFSKPFVISAPRVGKKTHYGQDSYIMAKYVLVTQKCYSDCSDRLTPGCDHGT